MIIRETREGGGWSRNVCIPKSLVFSLEDLKLWTCNLGLVRRVCTCREEHGSTNSLIPFETALLLVAQWFCAGVLA